jgi:SAM-dependent methyltransferase
MSIPWYESFFSPLALEFWRAVVPPEATEAEVAFVERALGLERPGRLLDLPCGQGRHALALAARGHRVTGIDLAPSAVASAAAEAGRLGLPAEFRVGDMRHPPGGAGFDGACCLGNSFGYLDHGDLLRFLHGMHAALRPRGRWVIDTGTAAESLLPGFSTGERVLEAGGIRFRVEKRHDATEGRLVERTTLERGDEREEGTVSYGIYTVAELRRLLGASGWRVLGAHGDLDGRPFSLGDRRLLLVAERS